MKFLLLLFGLFLQDPLFRLGDFCNLEQAVSVEMVAWGEYVPPSTDLNRILNWQGRDIAWEDDGAGYGAFAAPDFNFFPTQYTFTLANGDQQYVMVWEVEGTAYILGFDDLEITTDLNGEHEGMHHICVKLYGAPLV